MRWISALVLISCARPYVDPLAADRAALAVLREQVPPAGWQAHAAVTLSAELLDRVLAPEVSSGINAQMAPVLSGREWSWSANGSGAGVSCGGLGCLRDMFADRP